ncbi:MAG: mechanosensitive ion channel family protein [Gammaproteobacteria bacterium]|jgi:MscS family membrane protein|nr:mechanosensitive ion channel family protein [Gammaproteobacteria bacterium]
MNFSSHQALLYSFLSLLVAGIISIFLFFIFRYCYPKLARTERAWDDIALKAAFAPAQLLVWTYGITYAIEIFSAKNSLFSLDLIGMHARDFILILCLLLFLWRYVNFFEQRVTTQNYKIIEIYDKAKLLSFSRFIRVVIICVGIIALLQASGIPISGLLAFGGMGALIVGLAAKDLLANFFGGLLIYADRPFTVGDWISSPDKDIEGVVEKIGWRLTVIRRLDRRLLFVPNSIFSTISLENVSKRTHRRLLYIIGLRYSDLAVVDTVCQNILTALSANDEIDSELTYFAKLQELAASSINIKVQAFTKQISSEAFVELQHKFLLQVAQCVKQAGADFAFPTQTIEIPQLDQKSQ